MFPPLPGLEEGDGEGGPGDDSEEGGLESASYWKRKEALLRSSTVSLGVGERFFSGNCSQNQPVEMYIQRCIYRDVYTDSIDCCSTSCTLGQEQAVKH